MREYFSQFGDVNKIRMSRNKSTGQSKHFAVSTNPDHIYHSYKTWLDFMGLTELEFSSHALSP